MWMGGDNGALLQPEIADGALEAYNRLTADIEAVRTLLPRLEELRERCKTALGGQLGQGAEEWQPSPAVPPLHDAAAAAAAAPAASFISGLAPVARASGSAGQAPPRPARVGPAGQAAPKPAQGPAGLVRRIVGAVPRIEPRSSASQAAGRPRQRGAQRQAPTSDATAGGQLQGAGRQGAVSAGVPRGREEQGVALGQPRPQHSPQQQQQQQGALAGGPQKKKGGKTSRGAEELAAAAALRLLVGVSKCKRGWRARLKPSRDGPQGKTKRTLGVFDTPEAAARAYDCGVLVHQLPFQDKFHIMLNHPLEEYLQDACPSVAAAAAAFKARLEAHIEARQAEKAAERVQQGQQAEQAQHGHVPPQQAPIFPSKQPAQPAAEAPRPDDACVEAQTARTADLLAGAGFAAAAGAATAPTAGGDRATARPAGQQQQQQQQQQRQQGRLEQQGQPEVTPAEHNQQQAGAPPVLQGEHLQGGGGPPPSPGGSSSAGSKPKMTPIQALRRQRWLQQQAAAMGGQTEQAQVPAGLAAGWRLPAQPSGDLRLGAAQGGIGTPEQQMLQRPQPQQQQEQQQQQGPAAGREPPPMQRQVPTPLINLARGAGQGTSAVQLAISAAAACTLGYQTLPDSLMQPLREAAQHAQQEREVAGGSMGADPAAAAVAAGLGVRLTSSPAAEGSGEQGAAAGGEGEGGRGGKEVEEEDVPLAKRQRPLLIERQAQTQPSQPQQAELQGPQPTVLQGLQQLEVQRPEGGAAPDGQECHPAAVKEEPGGNSLEGSVWPGAQAPPLRRLPPVQLGAPRPPPLLLHCPGAPPALAGAEGFSRGKRQRIDGGTPLPPQLLVRRRGPCPSLSPRLPGQEHAAPPAAAAGGGAGGVERGGQQREATPDMIDMTWMEGNGLGGAHAVRCTCPMCKSPSPEVVSVKLPPRKVVSPDAFWEAVAELGGSAAKAGGGGSSSAAAAVTRGGAGGGGGDGGGSGARLYQGFSDPEAARQFKRSFVQPTAGKLAGAFRAARKQAAASATKNQKPAQIFPQTAWQQAAAAWRQKNKPSEPEIKAEQARQAKRARQQQQQHQQHGWNPAAAAAAAAGEGSASKPTPAAGGKAAGRGHGGKGSGQQQQQQQQQQVPPAKDPTFSSLPEGERRGRYRDYNQQRAAGCRSFAEVLSVFRVKCEPGGLKEGYRQAVRMYHPDSNSKDRLWGNPEQKVECEEIMKIINERKPERLE